MNRGGAAPLGRMARWRLAMVTRLRQASLGVQIAVLLGLATLPVGLLGVWQAIDSAHEAQALERQALIGLAERSAAEERAVLMSAFGSLTALATTEPLTGPTALETCGPALARAVKASPYAVLATLIDMKGQVVCRSDSGALINVADLPAIASFLMAPRQIVWASESGRASGVPVLVAATPVHDGDAVAGMLTLSLSRDGVAALVVGDGADARDPDAAVLTPPADSLRRADGASAGFRAMLMDADGIPLIADAAAGWRPETPILPSADRSEPVELVSGPGRDGAHRVYALAPIIEGLVYELATWSDAPAAPTLAGAAWRITGAVAFPLAMWLAALITAFFAMDRLVVQDIRRMRADIRAFARPDRTTPDLSYRDSAGEIAEVGRAFSAMVRIIAREEAAQKRLLIEKTDLLKELHHRVRNNLQLIISIINMQLRDTGGAAQRAALADLQARVMSIGAVHRAMFEAEDLGAVDAAELIGEIAAALGAARGPGLRIETTLEEMSIRAESALPVALIAAEAMLGSIARPSDKAADAAPGGELQIRLRRLPAPDADPDAPPDSSVAEAFLLEIDAPWPEGQQSARKALGARLMQALATQLTGEFTIEENDEGRRITLHVGAAAPDHARPPADAGT